MSPGEGPVAYSYVRFSTAKQELGDSLRRQVAMAEEYCASHGLTLHPYSYRDLGVSAFKRKNIEKGALASFIEAVKKGIVAKGSYLVIEQFDRLSRADTHKALLLLLQLVESGIKVVTLVDEKVWDHETIKETSNLILAIVYMSRANNESAAKARRLSEIWEQKKMRAAMPDRRVVTSECPRWLIVKDDRSGFNVILGVSESIEKVFDMYINGYGVSAIVTRANKELWPCPGKPPVRKSGEDLDDFKLRAEKGTTWHTSNVGRLLKNRALIGEYQPCQVHPEIPGMKIHSGEPIKNYYPVVIDEETFLRAQAVNARRGRFPGRRDASLKNWLQGILRCTCGQSFVRKNKNSLAQPDYALYYCSNRIRGVSKCPGANAKQLENAVISVLSTSAPQFFQGNESVERLKAENEARIAKLNSFKQSGSRIIQAISLSDDVVAELVEKLKQVNGQIREIEEEIQKVNHKINDYVYDPGELFVKIAESIDSVDSLDARAKLRENISRVVEKIVVHQLDGYIEVYLRGHEPPIVQPIRLDNLNIPGFVFY